MDGEIAGTLRFSMIKATASCIVLMPVQFTVYVTHREIGMPSYWNRSVETPDGLYVYPLILWSDMRARILIGNRAWCTIRIGENGTPVVEDEHGMRFTVSTFG